MTVVPADPGTTADPAGRQVPASAAELVRSLAEMAPTDPARASVRERAIEAWLPLARLLAGRYAGRGEPTDDLVQTATIGLIKAVDRFDPARGVEFAGFAVPTILGEVRRHFRDRTWSVRVPRRMQEMRMAINDASTTLTHTLGRSPTVADIAAHLGTTEEEVLEGLEGARAYSATSLSTPVGDGTVELADTLGGDDHEMELAEARIALAPAIARLDERAQTILSLRFFGNLTQSQIADRIGVSQMHVSRLIAQALGTLRAELTAG